MALDVTFYPVIPGGNTPQPADRSAHGTLPVRAMYWCEPVRLASAQGWYGYPPVDLAVRWDGSSAPLDVWIDGQPAPGLLPGHALGLPGYTALFNQHAPEALQDKEAPLISRAPLDPGMIQIWLGCYARTPPGWRLLVRPSVNTPPPYGSRVYEGVLDTHTDRAPRWFGSIFVNLALTKTDQTIEWPKGRELCQLVPVHEDALSARAVCVPLGEWTAREWQDYAYTARPHARPGEYARQSRHLGTR